MKQQKLNLLAGTLLAFMLIAGCSSDGNNAPIVIPPPPPPPPAPTSFNQFVVDQFAVTADNTDPVAVDDEDFAFDEDPSAFDSLLQ